MNATVLSNHFPALLIIIPLMSAPACILLYRAQRVWWLALASSGICLTVSAALLSRVLSQGVIRYELGGWAAPWGIEYRIDALNGLLVVLISAASVLCLLYARTSVKAEIEKEKIYLFYCAWLLLLTGLLGISITGDAFNVFVFLEISSLASYSLVSFGRQRAALSAAFRYLVMGTLGGTFILIGIGLLYALTGTLNMTDLATRIAVLEPNNALRAAFAFMTIGIAIKVALFPLHGWLPRAYSFAPSAAAAFIAATSTKVAVYMMLRFTLSIFGVHFSLDVMALGTLLMVLASLGVFVASMIAIQSRDLKLMLAWSSIAQVGYMMLGLALGSVTGLTATIVHVFNHALMKSALFMVAGCVALRIGSTSIDSLAGLGRRMPWTFCAFTLAGLSLIGVPFSAGFISKWYLLRGAFEQDNWMLGVLLVVTSLMALVYIGAVIEAAFFRTPQEGTLTAKATEAPMSMLIPMWLLVLANVYFGLNTTLTVGVAERAALALLGTGP